MAGGLHLLSLAPELKLNILQQLPATEIQRARIVSRDIKELVDTHSAVLASTIKIREYMRLAKDLKDATTFTLDLGVVVSRWMRRRGVWTDEQAQKCQAHMLAMLHARINGIPSPSRDEAALACVVRRLMQIRTSRLLSGELPYLPPFRTNDIDATMFMRLVEKDTGLDFQGTSPILTAWFTTGCETILYEKLDPTETFSVKSLRPELLPPEFSDLLTPYTYQLQPQTAYLVMFNANPFARSDLETVLSVPPFPSGAEGLLAYACKKERFRKAIVRKWWTGRRWRVLEEAAVLESLYIV